ncbi:hypothetical protein BJ741DRAFT_590786 [Chytriomyces cf. hyalinus JEL632]|nr:hypothetical protein BJ741DRAFT_590786 [Chytriomyces cf. hyalinus JEL632]
MQQQHPFPTQCISTNRRLKSCEPCRLQKKRCSQGEPCERCLRAGVACNYTMNSTKSKAFFALKRSTNIKKSPVLSHSSNAQMDAQVDVHANVQSDHNTKHTLSLMASSGTPQFRSLASPVPSRPASPASVIGWELPRESIEAIYSAARDHPPSSQSPNAVALDRMQISFLVQ